MVLTPINLLRDFTCQLAIGRLDRHIAIASQDEFGQLADAFNKMTTDLQKTTVSINILNEEIAERKRAEEKQKQLNEELEKAVGKLNESNKQLEQFCYIASHDMREPLRKIIAFGVILQKSLSGKMASDDAENLGYMIHGAERLTEMIEGLLAYSRIDTKGQEAQPMDLNQVVEQLQEFELSVLLEEKNAEIKLSQALPTVMADPAQTRQLVQNLIANGIKYQKKDSKPCITITAKPAAENMVRIEITDNGIGIKPEYQQTVFEMFKRLHTRSEYEGTGIGLAVCKKIVERHGGQIGVESQPDKGSTFWFTLPAATVAVSQTVAV
jgi:light-regulated signal transduction histidine kinase (bacteriophytochrome)